MTTDLSGTSPRYSLGSVPETSMTLVEAVITTLAPNTASFPILAPSTTMHLDPIKALSSIITGAACKGSKTPQIPTPPLRWTFFPIWAQLPTVAHVSTMVPAST